MCLAVPRARAPAPGDTCRHFHRRPCFCSAYKMSHIMRIRSLRATGCAQRDCKSHAAAGDSKGSAYLQQHWGPAPAAAHYPSPLERRLIRGLKGSEGAGKTAAAVRIINNSFSDDFLISARLLHFYLVSARLCICIFQGFFCTLHRSTACTPAPASRRWTGYQCGLWSPSIRASAHLTVQAGQLGKPGCKFCVSPDCGVGQER